MCIHIGETTVLNDCTVLLFVRFAFSERPGRPKTARLKNFKKTQTRDANALNSHDRSVRFVVVVHVYVVCGVRVWRESPKFMARTCSSLIINDKEKEKEYGTIPTGNDAFYLNAAWYRG